MEPPACAKKRQDALKNAKERQKTPESAKKGMKKKPEDNLRPSKEAVMPPCPSYHAARTRQKSAACPIPSRVAASPWKSIQSSAADASARAPLSDMPTEDAASRHVMRSM